MAGGHATVAATENVTPPDAPSMPISSPPSQDDTSGGVAWNMDASTDDGGVGPPGASCSDASQQASPDGVKVTATAVVLSRLSADTSSRGGDVDVDASQGKDSPAADGPMESGPALQAEGKRKQGGRTKRARKRLIAERQRAESAGQLSLSDSAE